MDIQPAPALSVSAFIALEVFAPSTVNQRAQRMTFSPKILRQGLEFEIIVRPQFAGAFAFHRDELEPFGQQHVEFIVDKQPAVSPVPDNFVTAGHIIKSIGGQ